MRCTRPRNTNPNTEDSNRSVDFWRSRQPFHIGISGDFRNLVCEHASQFHHVRRRPDRPVGRRVSNPRPSTAALTRTPTTARKPRQRNHAAANLRIGQTGSRESARLGPGRVPDPLSARETSQPRSHLGEPRYSRVVWANKIEFYRFVNGIHHTATRIFFHFYGLDMLRA